jgi:coenzyme F420-reducing hydrogenase beta subunit
MIELYHNKEDCCGCGACVSICPQNAISMQEDENGFIYPFLSETLCIGCRLCKEVCAYQNQLSLNTPKEAYVAASKNDKNIVESASGGIFAEAATYIIKNDGIVFGVAFVKENSRLIPQHIGVSRLEDLKLLQGSKYVQSDMRNSMNQAKKYLDNGRHVLFSGTPCQVAGLKGFLKKDYENLITMDIICHGVPSSQMFNDFLQLNYNKKNYDVVDFKFRDKSSGWGEMARLDYFDRKNKLKHRLIPAHTSSYFHFFLKTQICRENCYSCKYACEKRTGDITIGDYWGIGQEHPELLSNSVYSEMKGISCVMISTSRGEVFFRSLNSQIYADLSKFEKISKHNEQLREPSKKGKDYQEIFRLYPRYGYQAVEKYYKRKYFINIILHVIYNKIPLPMRKKIKKLLR